MVRVIETAALCTTHTSSINAQVASKRVANAKSDKFHKNIHRRGAVPESTQVRGTQRGIAMQPLERARLHRRKRAPSPWDPSCWAFSSLSWSVLVRVGGPCHHGLPHMPSHTAVLQIIRTATTANPLAG